METETKELGRTTVSMDQVLDEINSFNKSEHLRNYLKANIQSIIDHGPSRAKKRLARIRKLKKNCWKELRGVIIERDGCCFLCGKKYNEAETFNVHHLLEQGKTLFQEIEFEPLNLVLLCKDCHKWQTTSVHENPALLYIKLLKDPSKKEQVDFLENAIKSRVSWYTLSQ